MLNWKRLLCLLWLGLTPSLTLYADGIVIIPFRLSAPPEVETPTEGTLTVRQLTGERAGVVDTGPAPIPSQIRMHTQEGLVAEYQLGLPGYWSQPVTVAARKGHPPVELELMRAGIIAGKVVPAADSPAPTLITAKFRLPLGESEKEVLDGFVECPLDDELRFQCELPSGVMDLQLRVPSYVSHFFWGLPVPRGGKFSIGSLRLRHGGSIVGRVEVTGNQVGLEGVTVRAEPLSATGSGEDQRRDQLRRKAEVTSRGFFHLSGLPAGRYRVIAAKEGFGRAPAEVTTVRPNAETTLARSLRISPPGKIVVQVLPPLDPYDKPWSLTLQEPNLTRTSLNVLQIAKASPEGEWTSKPLPWGSYTLLAEDSAGDRWAWEELELDAEELPISLVLEGVLVDGYVTLDDQPLEADLYFGGRNGPRSVHLQSDTEGRFGGYLPEEGEWPVTVMAREPYVSRQIGAVSVETAGMGDGADVRIDLPATRLVGRLVNDKGRAAGGSVLVMASETRQKADQVLVGGDGDFEVNGLEPGRYVLQGLASGGNGSSWPVDVEVPKTGDTQEVVLRLRGTRVVEGTVRGPNYPVPGAVLVGTPRGSAETPQGQILLQATTDVEGNYSLTVPSDLDEIDWVVLPPGFALTTLRMRLPEKPALVREDVAVHQAEGSLALQWGEELGPWDGLTVIREGVTIGSPTLRQWAYVQGGDASATTLRIPGMSFGDYEACLFRATRDRKCRSGFLPPGGTLELILENKP